MSLRGWLRREHAPLHHPHRDHLLRHVGSVCDARPLELQSGLATLSAASTGRPLTFDCAIDELYAKRFSPMEQLQPSVVPRRKLPHPLGFIIHHDLQHVDTPSDIVRSVLGEEPAPCLEPIALFSTLPTVGLRRATPAPWPITSNLSAIVAMEIEARWAVAPYSSSNSCCPAAARPSWRPCTRASRGSPRSATVPGVRPS